MLGPGYSASAAKITLSLLLDIRQSQLSPRMDAIKRQGIPIKPLCVFGYNEDVLLESSLPSHFLTPES